MLEIHLSGRIFSSSTLLSSLLPASNINENLHIILSNNETFPIVSSFWKFIFNDKRLRILTLIDLDLNENDALLIAEYFHEQNHLIKLTFDSIRTTKDILNYIINEGLQINMNIKRLILTNLKNLDIIAVCNLIKNNQYIEYLSLRKNNLNSDDAIILVDALKLNTKLKSLDLSENSLNKNGALIFTNLFQQSHSTLIYINLIDNDIDHESQQYILSQCENSIRLIFSNENEPILTRNNSIYDQRSIEKKSQFLSIIFVTFLFFLWGIPYQLNDVLIRQFMKLFILSRFEAGLVQSAFYLGYFILALPAGYVLHYWGYKFGIILGFVLFGIGSFLFWPAALTGQYPPFLLALFVIATGAAFLETAANPYIANAAGPMETSEKRLNIAQAFNPLGVLTGALMGTFFIFSDTHFNEKEIEEMRAKHIYDDYLKQETLRLVQPYAILGGIAFLWAIVIIMVPFSTDIKMIKIKEKMKFDKRNPLRHCVFLFSILAQFAYVGAQVGTWSFFMQYAQDYIQVREQISHYLLNGTLALFAIGRFTAALFMHFGCSPSILLAICAFSNVILIILTVVLPNTIGIAALFFTSFFMAPMFPTIFALGIKNMDKSTTKLASCFLVMACIGGTICPSFMNLISVKSKRLALAYILPGTAYIIVAIFALVAYNIDRNKK